jgi:L-rhamnose mutarotase
MKRVASVIGLAPDCAEAYDRLHAAVWPEVLNRLRSSHVRNYSIFRYGDLLFSYLEYVGDDYEADMAAIAADPMTQEWWSVCEPMQRPVEGRMEGEWWHELSEVFHLP